MPTPTETQLEYEVTLARNDLEQNLSELKHLMEDKLDPHHLAQQAIDMAKEKAHELADRKLLEAKIWYAKTRDHALIVAGDKARAAQDLYLAKQAEAKELYLRTKSTVEEHPAATAAIVGGVVALVAGGIYLYRRYA